MVTRKVREEVKLYIERTVRAGYLPLHDIVETTVEVFSDDCRPDQLRPIAEALARELVTHIEREAESWPDETDCDRLDTAFAVLESRGIVARQNFSCCGTCGASEIQDEIEAERKNGKRIRGYTFFHMQDTESAAEGYGLWLSYGSTEEGEQAVLSIAREVVSILKQHNLSTRWDGTWEKRIAVDLAWKRRGPWMRGE